MGFFSLLLLGSASVQPVIAVSPVPSSTARSTARTSTTGAAWCTSATPAFASSGCRCGSASKTTAGLGRRQSVCVSMLPSLLQLPMLRLLSTFKGGDHRDTSLIFKIRGRLFRHQTSIFLHSRLRCVIRDGFRFFIVACLTPLVRSWAFQNRLGS